MSKGLNSHPYKRRLTKGKLLTLGALLFSFGVATSAVATSAFYSLLEIATVGNLNLEIDMTDAWLRLGLKEMDHSYLKKIIAVSLKKNSVLKILF